MHPLGKKYAKHAPLYKLLRSMLAYVVYPYKHGYVSHLSSLFLT